MYCTPINVFSPAKKADEGAEAERSLPAYGHGRKYAIVDFCLEGKPLLMSLARFCILLYPSLPYSSPRRSFLRLYSVLYTYTWLPGDISTSTPGVLALPRWLPPPVLNERTTSPPVAFAFDVRAHTVPQSARCPTDISIQLAFLSLHI